jgi:hypothetical protein
VSETITVTVTNLITGISIMDGLEDVSDEIITIAREDEKSLAASLSPYGATGTLIWSSENPSVATVDDDGKITGVAVGTAIITVSAINENMEAAVTATMRVNVVEPIPITNIAITNEGISVTSFNINIGDSLTLGYRLSPTNATGRISWESSNSTAVTVDSATGTITALTAGTANITARAVNPVTPSGVSSSVAVTVKNPVTGIVISASGTTVGETLEIAQGATITLNAALLPNDITGTITWNIGTGGGDIITITPTTGSECTITGVIGGTANLVVSAQNSDNSTAVLKTIAVTVTEVSSNIIWEWIYERDGGPDGTFTTSGTDAILTGVGRYTTVPVKLKQGAITDDNTLEGVVIDASGGSGTTGILIIGSNDGTDSTASTCAEGIFDFLTDNTNGIKVTLGCEILVDGTASGGRSVVVYVNNSTSGGSTYPLSTSNAGRIVYFQHPLASNTLSSATNGYWNMTDETLTSKTFKAADFTSNADTLENAFLGIVVLGNSGSNNGAKLLITAIRIEYVE